MIADKHLLVPFRNFWYYNPKQEGSTSIKSVLPAVTGKSYDALEIKEGGFASLEFLRVEHNQVSAEEGAGVRKALEVYCGLDIEGMVFILDTLREKVYK